MEMDLILCGRPASIVIMLSSGDILYMDAIRKEEATKQRWSRAAIIPVHDERTMIPLCNIDDYILISFFIFSWCKFSHLKRWHLKAVSWSDEDCFRQNRTKVTEKVRIYKNRASNSSTARELETILLHNSTILTSSSVQAASTLEPAHSRTRHPSSEWQTVDNSQMSWA